MGILAIDNGGDRMLTSCGLIHCGDGSNKTMSGGEKKGGNNPDPHPPRPYRPGRVEPEVADARPLGRSDYRAEVVLRTHGTRSLGIPGKGRSQYPAPQHPSTAGARSAPRAD